MPTLILLILSLSTVELNTMPNFNLRKESNTYLYRPRIAAEPWSKCYSMAPLFAKLLTGEILVIERGADKKGFGYFFSSNGELNNAKVLAIPGTNGKPGVISGVTSIFKTFDGKFGTYDNSMRLNLFDPQGNFTRSILIPTQSLKGIFFRAAYDQNILALGGLHSPNGIMEPGVLVVDYNTPSKEPLHITLSEDAYEQLKSKNATTFVNINVSVLTSRKVACNVGNSPDIYVVGLDGSVLHESSVPPHFRSLEDVEKLDSSKSFYNKEGRLTDETEQWLSTWTHSYPVYEISNNRLLVPRVLYPTFYLDLYSYSDKNVKYLGYAATDKEFLYADSSGVYFLESKDDTSIVVSKYEIVTPNFREERGVGWDTKKLTTQQLAGIHKVPPDTSSSDTCKPCDREKIKPKGYLKTIDAIKLIATDGSEYQLKNNLDKDKNHIIVFSSPQDCSLEGLLKSAEKYMSSNPDFDLALVFTHPYSEELKEFTKLVSIGWDYPVLTNLDSKRLDPILKSQASYLVVLKDGTITACADGTRDYPDFVPKPR